MPEAATPACGQCCYFVAAGTLHGCCHRYPARHVGPDAGHDTHHWRFPAVSQLTWCGEFRPQAGSQPLAGGGTS
ncbi:MAG: hypothetical protein FIB06_10580 [Betaproteobacteria bacterium]|nr:hypothetical protein [Betaproteobacteria bacterium]